MKPNKNFEFEVNLPDNTIEVINYNEDSFSISIDEFWDFIVEQEFNLYCNDYYDAREYDGHGQETGELTQEEYFENLELESIKRDLAIFLKKNNIKND
jgi:hypothetical protein